MIKIIVLSLVLLSGVIMLGVTHEQVHVEIYRHYGVDSHIEYFSHFPKFVTIPDEPCPNVQCISDQNLNEVVGYPLNVFFVVFGFFALFGLAELDLLPSKNKGLKPEEKSVREAVKETLDFFQVVFPEKDIISEIQCGYFGEWVERFLSCEPENFMDGNLRLWRGRNV